MAMDVNGDGKLDIVQINGDRLPRPAARKHSTSSRLSTMETAALPVNSGPISSAAGDPGAANKDNCKSTDRWMVIDFNGDGFPDLVKVMIDNSDTATSVRVYQNQNGSYLAKTLIFQLGGFYLTDGTTFAYTWVTGDFNGDGLVDIARIPKSGNTQSATTVSVYLSTGSLSTGLTAAQSWLPLTINDGDVVQTGDYNADGRSDLMVLTDTYLYQDPGGGGCRGICQGADKGSTNTKFNSQPGDTAGTTRSEYLSDGVSGFYLQASVFYSWNAPKSLNNKTNLTADFNGDGKEDLIRFFSTGGGAANNLEIYTSTPGYQDLLRKVTDGMGVAISIDYQPLTNPAIFTKSTDAVAPAIDLIEPMPVVATITYDNSLAPMAAQDRHILSAIVTKVSKPIRFAACSASEQSKRSTIARWTDNQD